MGRSKGTGYIFKRKETGIYYLEYKVNGRRKKVSLNTSRLKDKKMPDGSLIKGAETLAGEHLNPALEANTKTDILLHIAEARGILERSDITINNAWESYISASPLKAKSNTAYNYKKQWQRFVDWINNTHPDLTDLRQITEDIAARYAHKLETEDKLSASTFNQHRDLLHRVFKILTDRAGLISNPWEKVQRKERDGLTRHELTDTDIKKLMVSFEDPKKNAGRHPEYKTLFLIGRWTGMRLGDCCTLKWDKVDLTEEMIETIPGKTARINRKVMVPIFPELLAVLQKFAVGKTSDYVLPYLAAEYTKYEMGVKRKVVEIFNATGFKTTQKLANRQRATSILGFHSFRGSLTTKLLDKGVPFHIVKDIIGDNIATLEAHYTKTSRAKVQAAVKKIKF